MLAWLRTTLFHILSITALIAYIPVLLLGLLLPFKHRYPLLTSYGQILIFLARWVLGIRYRISGLEHLPKSDAVLILAKHQSAWETLFLPSILKQPAFVLKKELLKLPIFGQGLTAIRPIAIDRSQGRKALAEILKQGIRVLGEGRDVVLFPEGTRTTPDKPGQYRLGGAILASRIKQPVIPMAVNSGCCWPRSGYRKYPGTIEVVFGPPLQTQGLTPEQINQAAREWIENQQQMLYQRYECPSNLASHS